MVGTGRKRCPRRRRSGRGTAGRIRRDNRPKRRAARGHSYRGGWETGLDGRGRVREKVRRAHRAAVERPWRPRRQLCAARAPSAAAPGDDEDDDVSSATAILYVIHRTTLLLLLLLLARRVRVCARAPSFSDNPNARTHTRATPVKAVYGARTHARADERTHSLAYTRAARAHTHSHAHTHVRTYENNIRVRVAGGTESRQLYDGDDINATPCIIVKT